jgi:hypothetical protein
MKTKLFTLAFLSTIIMLFTTGCQKRNCLGFPEHLVGYYPYAKEDILQFTNPQNDTLSFLIENSWKTEAQSYRCEKCACDYPSLNFYTGYDRNYTTKDSFYINGNILLQNGNSILSCLFYQVRHVNGGEDYFSKTETTLDAFNPNNPALFGDTVVLIKENAIRINRVVIVKGVGITEFFDTERNCLWTKIN